MHFHSDLIARQVLWTLTFAAQMVLLVVLIGRDRVRRFPWFTAAIALAALHLMAEVLLVGRMAMLPLQEILITMDDLTVIVGLLVVVEVARRAFAGLERSLWIANTTGLLLVTGLVLAFWGPWLTKKDMVWDTIIARLHLMQFAALKGNVLVALLTVALGLLVVIFGRQFKSGWRSQPQMIAIGLSTVGVASLVALVIFNRLQVTVQEIFKSGQPNARQQYEHIVTLATNLGNARELIYVFALVWWIVWLWRDEPGTAAVDTTEEKPQS